MKKIKQFPLVDRYDMTGAHRFCKMMICPVVILLSFTYILFAQASDQKQSGDSNLLDSYISSKNQRYIVFTPENIKQFWISNSVTSQNDSINILMKQANDRLWESDNLRIQLIHVDPTMDCRIDVIMDDPGLSFSVLNSKGKELSTSSSEQDFIQYHITSSTLHMEDVMDLSFYLKFSSDKPDSLSIKRIVLSFPDNPKSSFRKTPGSFLITKDMVNPMRCTLGKDAFTLTGSRSIIFLKDKIILSDKDIRTSVRIKNTGKAPAQINIGFATYAQDGYLLDGKNYPYNNKIHSVVSAEVGSNSIVVDSLPEWRRNCNLAINVKEDLSDIPNMTLIDGRVQEIKALPDGTAEIVMEKPLKTKLKKGEKLRVHGLGEGYIYTNSAILQPGEEKILSSAIHKDESVLSFSSKGFSRGVNYVIPLILSYSVGNGEAPTVLISDYTISY